MRVGLNLVEVRSGIIERHAIRRGAFPSVRDLTDKIRAFMTSWNRRKHPFIWTQTQTTLRNRGGVPVDQRWCPSGDVQHFGEPVTHIENSARGGVR